jgi:O-antigen/teichoic acid export membrane protein
MRVWSTDEVGIWMVIAGNSLMFLNLFNLGITPTITRHIALAKGGSGADPNVELTPETERHIADLVATGRAIFRTMAIVIPTVAFPVGWLYLSNARIETVSLQSAVIAWLIVCVGYGIAVWVQYLDCWMVGVGLLSWNAAIVTGVAIATLVINTVAVLLGGKLISLACILVGANLVQRALTIHSMRRQIPRLFALQGHWNRQYARNLVQPALRAWLLVVGMFLVAQTAAYFILRFRSASEVPAYGAASALLSNLFLLAVTLANSSTVFLSQAWQAGDADNVRRQTLRFAQIGMAIMAAGVGFVLIAGRDFIELWLSRPDSFVGYGIILIFCAVYTLDAQANILSTCARSTEDERYAVSSLAAGVLNFTLIACLIEPLGLFGVALSLLIAQLLTNHWYLVYRPMVRLRISGRDYLRRVILLWLLTLGSTLAAGYFLVERLRTAGVARIWLVLIGLGISGAVLGAALWWNVLDARHRQRFFQIVRQLLAAPARFLGKY